MKVGLLYCVDSTGIENYILACKKKSVDYCSIDIASSDWLDRVNASEADLFINRPEGCFEYLKVMYDERLYIISEVLHKIVFPTYQEVKLYENKKMLSYFLEANIIPHAKTKVFYDKDEAFDYVNRAKLPIVAKTSIGAAGSGVKILRSIRTSEKYIKIAFGKQGIKARFGPNKNKGNLVTWSEKALMSPMFFVRKLKNYFHRNSFGQRGYVIFQEYLEHDFEWRVTKCGDYYYAFQKLKNGDKCSGCGIPDGHAIEPPLDLLDFVRNLCLKYRFNSMAVDILNTNDGVYRVNELQTHWGVDHYDCMIINGKRGIYKYEDGWKFIEGEFWSNFYFDTRLEAAIDYYNKKK